MKSLLWLLASVSLIAMAGCANAKKKNETAAGATPPSNVSHEAAPAAAEAPDAMKVTCAQGDEVRSLTVVKKGSGCTMEYEKIGKTSAVSSAAHGVGHCKQTQAKIRAKLEAAGYKCT